MEQEENFLKPLNLPIKAFTIYYHVIEHERNGIPKRKSYLRVGDGGRRLFNNLLVAPLDGTITTKYGNRVSVFIRQ